MSDGRTGQAIDRLANRLPLAGLIDRLAGQFGQFAQPLVVEMQQAFAKHFDGLLGLDFAALDQPERGDHGRGPRNVVRQTQDVDARGILELRAKLDRLHAEVLDMVDKRIGLTDLIYGMTNRQIRSATEADIKEQNTNIRPDDMAGRVEDFLSATALNEMAACVWGCTKEDVTPVLGELGASIFESQIQTQDFERVVMDYDYRVAAGSARKPNKQSKQRALTELGQVMLPSIQEFARSGVVAPWNAYMTEIAETMDINPEGFLLPEPEPQEGPSQEDQAAEMEMKSKQLEMRIKQAEFEMKQRESQQQSTAKTEMLEAAAAIKSGEAREQLQLDREEHVQELRQDAEVHRQEMEQSREVANQDILKQRAELAMMTKEQQLKLEGLKKMQVAQVAAKRAQARAAMEDRSGDDSESDDDS